PLIEAYGQIPKLANYLHLPVQAGSDRILAAMKRGYTVAEYRHKVARLRRLRPEISLSTDIIVGYPGETDADFEATMALVEAVGFDQAFSFIYSKRPGTPAADMDDPTPREVKRARLSRLQRRIEQGNAAYMQAMVGTTQRVLVEGPARRGGSQLTGRSDSNRWLNFDGPVELIGQMALVRVTEALTNSLRGRLIEEELAVTA
ncbi:MAG: TRAM domain-containing protein, partial [Salinisphaera sp.]|nr:TRAM domain-containing protein [Salinisphaera sp.]